MRDSRSSSQILFGFLPEQTVDLKGRIWKVSRWHTVAMTNTVDMTSLVRELRRLAAPWRTANMDGGFVADLDLRNEVVFSSLDRANGVQVVPFPEVWQCKACRRYRPSPEGRCKCGSAVTPGQLPFVAYHNSCGHLRTPYIPKCPQHNDVRIEESGTASAAEIRFVCPECNTVLRQGFGFPNCSCGNGQLSHNVHRSASVFTPHNVVIVNPPIRERIKRLQDSGGRGRALEWVVRGMVGTPLEDTSLTPEILRQQLRQQGLLDIVIENMILAAEQGGAFSQTGIDFSSIPGPTLEEAQAQAVSITMAVDDRGTVSQLVEATAPYSELGIIYRDQYPAACREAGIEAVDFIGKFPILSGHYGYTRGGADPTTCRLVTYQDRDRQRRVIYGEVAVTEALYIRLAPTRVLDWLRSRGHPLPLCNDDTDARIAILREARVPTSDLLPNAVGEDLLTLVHSLSHRFMRAASVLSGIDRNSLSELLMPLHLGFFMYAVPRGDFVLGGLQAVFEGDLHTLLREITRGEHRCALDPGCSRSGGACMGCLHVGEPSCRFFNRYLDRQLMFGVNGYLSANLPT